MNLYVTLFIFPLFCIPAHAEYGYSYQAQQEVNRQRAMESAQRYQAQQEVNRQRAIESAQRYQAQQEVNRQRAMESAQRYQAQQEVNRRMAAESARRYQESRSYPGSYPSPSPRTYSPRTVQPPYYTEDGAEVIFLGEQITPSAPVRFEGTAQTNTSGGKRYPIGQRWQKRQEYRGGPITTNIAGHDVEEWVIEFRLVVDESGQEKLETNPAENPKVVARREKDRTEGLDGKRNELVAQAKSDHTQFQTTVVEGWWKPIESKIEAWVSDRTTAVSSEPNVLIQAKLKAQLAAKKKPFLEFSQKVKKAITIEQARRSSQAKAIEDLSIAMGRDSAKQATHLSTQVTESRKSSLEKWENEFGAFNREWSGDGAIEGLSKEIDSQPSFEEAKNSLVKNMVPYSNLIAKYSDGYRSDFLKWHDGDLNRKFQEQLKNLQQWEAQEKALLKAEPLEHIRRPVTVLFEMALKRKSTFLANIGKLFNDENDAETKYLGGVQTQVEEAFSADVPVETIQAKLEAQATSEAGRMTAAREKIVTSWEGSPQAEGFEALWKQLPNTTDSIALERGRYPLTERPKACAQFSRRVELRDLETNFAFQAKETVTALYAFQGFRSFECVDDHAVAIVESLELRNVEWDKTDEALAQLVNQAKKRSPRGWLVWTQGTKLIRIEEPRLETVSFRSVRRPSDESKNVVASFSDGVGEKNLPQVEDFSLELDLADRSTSVRNDTLAKDVEQKSESWEGTRR